MKKFKIKRQYDPSYKGGSQVNGETSDQPSKTLPDQTISLRKLLQNHTRGIPSPGMKQLQGQYFETEIPVINDLVDIQEYREELKAKEELLKKEVDEYFDQKRREAAAVDAARSVRGTGGADKEPKGDEPKSKHKFPASPARGQRSEKGGEADYNEGNE